MTRAFKHAHLRHVKMCMIGLEPHILNSFPPSSTTSLLSKGVGVTPLMAKLGTKNLVTDSMKPTSATTVGLCSRTCICTQHVGAETCRC